MLFVLEDVFVDVLDTLLLVEVLLHVVDVFVKPVKLVTVLCDVLVNAVVFVLDEVFELEVLLVIEL